MKNNAGGDEKEGVVFLIPTVLSEGSHESTLPAEVRQAIEETDYYLVEELRTARRFLSGLKTTKQVASLHFYELNKDTPVEMVIGYFKEIPLGENIAILSEAGCPGVADPGSIAVGYAHKIKRKVKPLVGPSSILLALMASGFNGQSFTFHGYLSLDAKERTRQIQGMEMEARKMSRTQLFMETPYRNNQLIKDLLNICRPDTRLSIAADLTAKVEYIKTQTIREWKDAPPDLHKRPAIFAIYY
jgi:16S rRNA (cytidine1402-2'-O)-methyltransferase